MKRLDSTKESKGLNLDFVPPDLEFVPLGLDFVPKNLDLPVDPREPCALLEAAGPSIHPERGEIETEDSLLLDPFVAVLLSDR